MKKLNQKGFGVIEILIILAVISIIGGAGWYVWNKNNSSSQSTTSTDQPKENKNLESNTNESAISKNWKRYKSGREGFSIKLADGLDGLRDTSGDFFIFRYFTSNEGPAKVENVDGYGSDGFTALVIYKDDKSNLWNPDRKLNVQEEKFTTYSGLTGTKTSYNDPYEPPCEGLGCYLGDKHVIYDFEDNNGKVTRIWYGRRIANEESKKMYEITQDDPDYTSSIDEMVKTLEVK